MNSSARFSETGLPAKEDFYSRLSECRISDEDYCHAQRVWTAFGCSDMGDYHDLYLKTDVHLLADVFEKFRCTAMATYDLDPTHYYTLPGFAWDALLKHTGISLTLLDDVDMHLFVERGLRGGVTMASHRHARANNKNMSSHDTEQASTYLQYLDANNLYGWAMSQHLPTSKFQWCVPSDELLQKILTQPDDADTGYMVECDLSVPTEFHDRLNDYPPAPERVTITESMMSPYQRDLIAADPVSGLSAPKLVPNLMPKQRYVAHYRNLRLYSHLGLRIDAVHRVLSFRQAPWMKPYIQLNTELRKKAKNDFEKDFFKLMNNAVFGKTMENVRRRISIRLLRVEDEEDTILTAVAKSTYVRHVLFDNGLVGVENRKLAVHLNKPVYVGMSILELSKELMYRFYYDELQPRYGDRMSLLYTDTDSLVLLFRTEDLYADMKSMADQYDTSNFSPDSPLYRESNKKVVGKFKDELGGKLMTEFVALRSKMYAYDVEESGQRAKGVKRAVTRRFTIADYRQCLVDRTRMSHAMTTLRSHSHRIFTETMTKSSLSPFDSKRYIRADGVSTLAHGHHRIALLDD